MPIASRTPVTSVTIRMYDVGFGDCFLVAFEQFDRADVTFLIDCGRYSGTLLEAPLFWDVVAQVIADLPRRDGNHSSMSS